MNEETLILQEKNIEVEVCEVKVCQYCGSDNLCEWGIIRNGDTRKEKIITPEQIRDEIPTLNEYGYMKIELDEFAAEFIEYAGQASLPLLELGSAYGYTAHKY